MEGGGGLTYEPSFFGVPSEEPPPAAPPISSVAVSQEWTQCISHTNQCLPLNPCLVRDKWKVWSGWKAYQTLQKFMFCSMLLQCVLQVT